MKTFIIYMETFVTNLQERRKRTEKKKKKKQEKSNALNDI
jgi:hypothetical protein